jgi:hypothetical protein
VKLRAALPSLLLAVDRMDPEATPPQEPDDSAPSSTTTPLPPPAAAADPSTPGPSTAAQVTLPWERGSEWGSLATYSDGKVANRNVRVSHGATENGPLTVDKSQTFAVGYNRVEGKKRRASRNGRVSDLPPDIPCRYDSQLFHR